MNIQDKNSRYTGIFLKMLQEQYKPDTDGSPQSFLAAKIALFQATLQNGPYSADVKASEINSTRMAAQAALNQYAQIQAEKDQSQDSEYEYEDAASKVSWFGALRWPSGKFWFRSSVGVLLVAVYIVSNLYFKGEGLGQATPAVPSNSATVMTLDVEVADFNNKSLTLLFMPTAGNFVGSDGMLAKDIQLDVDGGKISMKHIFKANEPLVPFAAEIAIDTGDILDYPFDRYEAAVDVQANVESKVIPIKLILNNIPHGLKASMLEKAGTDNEVGEKILLKRSFVGLFGIGLAVFSVVLVAASSLWVAYYLIVTGKPIGFDVLVWTAALLFVIPTVRDSLPGKPPLGCSIDFLVFFWLQAIVAFATLGLVIAWFRHMRRMETVL